MKDRKPLLKQILLDDDLAGFRQESLEAGLVALRTERRRRKVVRGSAPALLAATAIFQPISFAVLAKAASALATQ